MSLTEPTSRTFDAGRPLGADAPRLGEAASTWSYLRSLSGAAEPSAAAAPEWADDERLDELFSAWAEAALAADVVTDRGPVVDDPEPAAPVPAPECDASAYEPLAPLDDPVGPAAPEPLPAWSRSDDEIIPQPRGRWGRRRR